MDLSVVLLHENMVDKHGALVTTSLTLIDIHDIARSATSYALTNAFIAHPAPTLRKLARIIQDHWDHGYGASYNPDRKEALSIIDICCNLDEVIHKIELRSGKFPHIIATSAQNGHKRTSFYEMRRVLEDSSDPFLLMLGTGWGMSDYLLSRAEYFLEPVKGPAMYNHLSVRSACAIILDRLRGI